MLLNLNLGLTVKSLGSMKVLGFLFSGRNRRVLD